MNFSGDKHTFNLNFRHTLAFEPILAAEAGDQLRVLPNAASFGNSLDVVNVTDNFHNLVHRITGEGFNIAERHIQRLSHYAQVNLFCIDDAT